jgi:hypothetical protein
MNIPQAVLSSTQPPKASPQWTWKATTPEENDLVPGTLFKALAGKRADFWHTDPAKKDYAVWVFADDLKAPTVTDGMLEAAERCVARKGGIEKAAWGMPVSFPCVNKHRGDGGATIFLLFITQPPLIINGQLSMVGYALYKELIYGSSTSPPAKEKPKCACGCGDDYFWHADYCPLGEKK